MKDLIPYQIRCGDSAEILKELPDKSVDLVITSPPYYRQRSYNGLGVGNEQGIEPYIDALDPVFGECVRITKNKGNIVYNLGDSIQYGSYYLIPHRFAIQMIDDYNVKLINEITWVKKNPVPRQHDRKLVPSTEPFFHFAKTSDYYYDRDAFYPEGDEKPVKRTYKYGKSYYQMIRDSELTLVEKEKATRALTEVIAEVHDGKIQGFRMKIRGVHAEPYGGQAGGRLTQMVRDGFTIVRKKGKKMKKDVITSPVATIPGRKHPAIYPLDMIRELIKLLCPVAGLVLDPYLGSGTTAVAALQEKRRCFGIDIDPLYCDDAMKRINSL